MSDHPLNEKPASEKTQQPLLDQLAKLAPPNQKELFGNLIAQSEFYFDLTDRLRNKADRTQNLEPQWDLLHALFGGSSLAHQLSSTELSRLLGLPSIEEIKDQADLFSEMAQKIAQLQTAQQKMNVFFKGLNSSASEQFNAKKSDTLNTKALYSLWVECGEQAFSKLSQSDQYIESQAELLNALTSMNSLQKKIARSVFQKSGISSNQDLETIYQNIHTLKREFRQKSRQQALEITTLKEEIASLQKKQVTPSKRNK